MVEWWWTIIAFFVGILAVVIFAGFLHFSAKESEG